MDDAKLVDWVYRKLQSAVPENVRSNPDRRPKSQEVMGWMHVVCYYVGYAKNIERMQLDSQREVAKLAAENAAIEDANDHLRLQVASYEAELKRGKAQGQEVNAAEAQVKVFGWPKDLRDQIGVLESQLRDAQDQLAVLREMPTTVVDVGPATPGKGDAA